MHGIFLNLFSRITRKLFSTAFEHAETSVKLTEPKPIEPIKSFPDIDGHCDCNTCSLSCKKVPLDGDEQRQSAIDFEDEIQDFVYVKTSDGGVETSQKESSRARRETQIKFPDEIDKETTKKKEPETESILNEEGEYTYFYREINDSSQTSFELTKLRHYTHYVRFTH